MDFVLGCRAINPHRVIQRNDHRLHIGRAGGGVTDPFEWLGAGTTWVVEGAVTTLQRRDLDKCDVTRGFFVTDQDDVGILAQRGAQHAAEIETETGVRVVVVRPETLQATA